MDSIVVWNKIQLRTSIAIVSPIFHARVVCGCHQIRGNARGPTQKTAMIIKDFRKYHWIFSSAKRGSLEASRKSPQCLHFIASSWISSAQKGHFFIIISLGSKMHYRLKPKVVSAGPSTTPPRTWCRNLRCRVSEPRFGVHLGVLSASRVRDELSSRFGRNNSK